MPPKTTPKSRPKTTPKSRPGTTPEKQSKSKASKKRSTVNVNWAEKLGITAPGAELRKDLGPLISRNLKPVFQVPPPVGNDRPDKPTLNESWEKAVKKGPVKTREQLLKERNLPKNWRPAKKWVL